MSLLYFVNVSLRRWTLNTNNWLHQSSRLRNYVTHQIKNKYRICTEAAQEYFSKHFRHLPSSFTLPQASPELPQASPALPRTDFHRFPSISVDFRRFPPFSVVFRHFPSFSVIFRHFLSSSALPQPSPALPQASPALPQASPALPWDFSVLPQNGCSSSSASCCSCDLITYRAALWAAKNSKKI